MAQKAREDLKQLYARNRAMPNGGARLLEAKPAPGRNYWVVSDGRWHYGKFKTLAALRAALKEAGFRSHAGAQTVYWHTF